MNNGDSLTGVGWSHDMLILPKSILDSTFYVFVAGVVVPDTGLWYSIVDMKLQGGLGQVVQKMYVILIIQFKICLQQFVMGMERIGG